MQQLDYRSEAGVDNHCCSESTTALGTRQINGPAKRGVRNFGHSSLRLNDLPHSPRGRPGHRNRDDACPY
jgi:hypothetical protein